MQRHERGQTLAELTVVLAILGIVVTTGTVGVSSMRRRVALTAATSAIRADMQRARTLAIAQDRSFAIKFRDAGDTWTWTLYRDGDGDGVRNDDINRGIDKPAQRTRRFLPPARIGLPSGPVPDPFNGGLLNSRSPIRFTASGLCSFSRSGEASNGSLVMTNGPDAVVMQIHGATARITVLRWNGSRWRTGV